MLPGGPPGRAVGLPKIGQILSSASGGASGKYEIVRSLGEGGISFLFEARDTRVDQRRVAIKMLAPDLADDAELVERFEREARAVAQLRTKHAVRVIEVDATDDGLPYIVTELLEGRDLDAELQERTKLPLGESIEILVQACTGMLDAHRLGIVHRDLKPKNLFLATEKDSAERVVKILDFGISKIVGDASRLTGVGTVMGTILYMAPEQVRAENVDTRADIWSLGVILFELLAGRTPFDGTSQQIAAKILASDPPDLRAFVAVPEGVALAVRRMLERDLPRRFARIEDVISALTPFAPMGSASAVATETTAGGSTRGRTVSLGSAALKHTMPMLGSSGFAARARATDLRAPLSLKHATADPWAQVSPITQLPIRLSWRPPQPPPQPPQRRILAVAASIVLLGIIGVALIVVTLTRHPRLLPSGDGGAATARP